MKWECRPLRPGEIDHELVWLLFSLGSAAAVALWLWLQGPWPVCAFHQLTGHPCLTCGATRSALAFSHGDFFSALKWNPLACFAYAALVIANTYVLVVVLTRARRIRALELTRRERRWSVIGVIVIAALNWIYLLLSNPPL